MTALSQFALFLSSYTPLFLVFALLGTFGNGWSIVINILIAAAGAIVLTGVFYYSKVNLTDQKLEVATTQIRDGDVLAYVATYIVPFAAMNASSARDRWAIVLFVVLIALLYVRSQLFYVNPLLALVGYRLFQVVTEHDASVVLISRQNFVRSHTTISARRLSDYVYWEVKK
jgi:hypothetical protein